jgi:hypothetical protein
MRKSERSRSAWWVVVVAWLAGCGAATGSGAGGEGISADEGAPFVFGRLPVSELQPAGRVPSPAEVCPEEAARGACRMRVEHSVPCSGVPTNPEHPEALAFWVCICDLCAEDADCAERSGGRCALLFGDTCDHNRRICQYPGDTCYDPAACTGGTERCMHHGGRAVCAEPAGPPP